VASLVPSRSLIPAFVDYSGKKPHIIDVETGEAIEVELFVAVLGQVSFLV
jgi:hypothetical protein